MSRHYLVHSPEELHQLARGFRRVERRRGRKHVSIPGERFTLRHARVDFQRHATESRSRRGGRSSCSPIIMSRESSSCAS